MAQARNFHTDVIDGDIWITEGDCDFYQDSGRVTQWQYPIGDGNDVLVILDVHGLYATTLSSLTEGA